jgi:uncharacterized protein with PIN domain
MNLRERILKTLEEVGFRTGEGTVSPLNNPLPLVTGWAVDDSTASFAVIVEDPTGVRDEDPWRELLFALSGVRHELRDGGPVAIGTPVVIAILHQEEHAQRLRQLIEDMSARYILFSRVELNVVLESTGEADVARALAPLLPNCRRALAAKMVIGPEALAALADELKAAVADLAKTLEAPLDSRAHRAAEDYGAHLADLVRGESALGGFASTPWSKVALKNFRSFADQEVCLGSLNVLEGLNGTGKSSVVEALEILWAQTSQRKPVDETSAAYDKHLARDGEYGWKVSGYRGTDDAEPKVVSSTTSASPGSLARNVFSQDGSTDIARETSKTRYSELLRITGLAIPELQAECQRLNRNAKAELDSVLSRLNIEPLTSIAARATDHVTKALARVAAPLSTTDAVAETQQRLAAHAESAGLVYEPLIVSPPTDFGGASSRALALAAQFKTDAKFIQQVRQLYEHQRETGSQIDTRARALEALAAALSARRPPEQGLAPVEGTARAVGLPEAIASQWLQTGRILRRSIGDLRTQAAQIADPSWGERLAAFLEAAEQTLQSVPFDELDEVVGHAPTQPLSLRGATPKPLDPEVFAEAGFDSAEDVLTFPPELETAVTEASRALRDYSSDLSRYMQSLLSAPLVQLEGSEEALLDALTKFELAKRLKHPIDQVQADMLARLLSGPLEPLLTELIAALTRFEWYFHPFKMSVDRGSIRLSGLATASDELDVRMLLNAGERAIVTVAWFLALHLLQPESHRNILVLDDPFSTLDENNQAALIATLRAVTRLTTPDLLVLTSHDRGVADALEREFGALDGWPATTARIRFSRSPDGTSKTEGEPGESPQPDYDRELARLGIASPAQLVLGAD